MLLLGSTVFNFIAVRYLQLTVTGSIAFTGPLIATALAGPVLGEWAGPRRLAAVAVAFVGVLIVIQPAPSSFNPAAIYSVCSALCFAGYLLTTRMLSSTDSPAGMFVYGAALATAMLTPTLPALAVMPPDWTVVAALVCTGIAGAIGHWLLIAAHRAAPPAVLAPFIYTELIWLTPSAMPFSATCREQAR